MPDYIEELNEGQRNAVLYNDGPVTGDSRCRFGKDARADLQDCLSAGEWLPALEHSGIDLYQQGGARNEGAYSPSGGPERARHLWMGTFHSMFLRILHVEAGYIGFTSQFTIYDTADSKSLIRSIIKEMGLDEKVYKDGAPSPAPPDGLYAPSFRAPPCW